MAKTILYLEGLDLLESDKQPVKRLKMQLSKGFNPNKNGDIGSLITLISYSYALGHYELIRSLFEQVRMYAKYDSNTSYLWDDYGLLLIFMADISESKELRNEYLSPIFEKDIYGGHETRLESYFEFSGELYQEDAVVASFETQKYQCEYMSGHITQLLYFKHMLAGNDVNADIENEIEMMLENSTKYLIMFLSKKTPFEPMEFFNGLPSRIRGAGLDAVSRYMKALKYDG